MFRSVDPYHQTVWAELPEDIRDQVNGKIRSASEKRFERTELIPHFKTLASILRKEKSRLALLLTKEMGKPISQSEAEIEKCAWLCEYYADNAPTFLSPRIVETDASKSYVLYEPYGVWLAIMPWNFPFWQVFRCAVPAILAGNKFLLKHASNVQQSALAIQSLFEEAGMRDGIFQVLHIKGKDAADIIAHPAISGISLTGSLEAGSHAASIAAKNIKPQVLELGGSNAFIVTENADIEKAVNDAIIGRFQNNGQSCIAAKRILLARSIEKEFTEKLVAKVASLKVGDPTDSAVYIGPLVSKDAAEELFHQVEQSISEGAKVLVGHKLNAAIYHPTVLSNVTPDMHCMKQELFGPVVPIFVYDHWEEAVTVSNSTAFGLGVSIYVKDPESIADQIARFDEGAVFINSIVKSDPRLPFGGVKTSGIGRELSLEGIHSFCRVKTVYIA
jgi:succinate-semialdehyde dehydrogenase/glutarate-semialdehyde dehydrogenase